jgi:hypothetical protein
MLATCIVGTSGVPLPLDDPAQVGGATVDDQVGASRESRRWMPWSSVT